MGEHWMPTDAAGLVTTDWVENHLGAPSVRLIEVDEDITAFDRGHLPGAVAWHWRDDLHDPVHRDIIDRARLISLLRRWGIGPGTMVVFYGGNRNWFASYAYWILAHHGYPEVRLMDGGRQRWEAEGRPVSRASAPPSPAPQPILDAPRTGLRILRPAMLPLVLEGRIQCIDARAPTEFRGEMLAPPHHPDEQAHTPGRMPGAVNLPWSHLVSDDGGFLDGPSLRSLAESAGVDPSVPGLVYGRTTERGALTWFVLHEILGHPSVAYYDGGWTEYGSLVGVPVER